ncbi:TetR/AcrR family transcriptional regulator [Amycolatopsis cihanbeyliensis]|uniref:TetR family transcriptional regulator n=1 Tax=Amycolatopsis cihanbeyliensis TaxID=1128664 RepID=A0A542CTQ6_AMYCI|nr:TetR/AcrR family transcriptional regulator [Amycolatopsis cihanbeyliensis]TQI94170.1 TetR family transcriptional regulator [Amycolatopsis cihanbeyliensis]
MPRRSQQDRTRATTAALVTAGRELLARHGYAQVSAEQIVSAAGVTRGALHHHFGDKRGLFVAVLDEIETELTADVAEALHTAADQWTGMVTALGRFLDNCRRPEVVQLALIDAPAVLGWQGWREQEAQHGLGVITEALRDAAGAGLLRPAPVPALAQLVLSALIEASLIIAHAEDKAAARADAEQSLLLLLSGLLTEPDPGTPR